MAVQELILLLSVLVYYVSSSCENCRPFEFCRDGVCSEASCDRQSRWHFTNPTGYIRYSGINSPCIECVTPACALWLYNKCPSSSDGPGNYSANMRCTWLISTKDSDKSPVKSKIRLRIDNFATECSWDHLYVWDGDSTASPLIASLSGVYQEMPNTFEITTTSGAAFVHFYSDPAFTMAGFNISYETEGCELDCSSKLSHGSCVALASNGGSRTCICDQGWTGGACDVPLGCPGSYSCQNGGVCVRDRCTCVGGFKGPDCSLKGSDGYWESISIQAPTSQPPPPSASHATVLLNQMIYWIGGETFQDAADLKTIHRLDMASLTFQAITSKTLPNPTSRFGHSVVACNESLYMFGGVTNGTIVVNELWQWEQNHEAWIFRKYEPACKITCAPFPATGHTAHVIAQKMLVFFGYGGAEYGFLNNVQEYNFITRKWSVVSTGGAFVMGTYGHASAYDSKTGLVYLHGGYSPSVSRQYVLTDRLLSYDPDKAYFRKLQSSPSTRFLHSFVIMDREILLFGGNQHSESSARSCSSCYSSDFYSYDIECDTWKVLKQPVIPYSTTRLSRYGHSALVFKGQMFIFGGFQGILLNDVLRYTAGECLYLVGREECIGSSKAGRKCAWSERSKQCLEANNQLPGVEFSKCKSTTSRAPETDDPACTEQSSCHDCLSNSQKSCIWCKDGNKCSSSPCKSDSGQISAIESCPRELLAFCSSHLSCMSCLTLSNNTCTWRRDDGHGGVCAPKTYTTITNDVSDAIAASCDTSCNARLTCDTCSTQSGACMWCANEQKCIESNAYLATFPYGQCRDWQAMNRRCDRISKCDDFKSCSQCMESPDCGWCDDGSSTGLGFCSAGSNHGPAAVDACSISSWFFLDCPKCNCNGHARCMNGSNTCQGCQDFTEGLHCDRCVDGRYGDPRNGGQCSSCLCPINSKGCDPENGNCKCTTKGTTGRRCDRCDESNHYVGLDGVCFYELPVGYQFTFNLTKSEDMHFTGINFKTMPQEKDYDVKFTLVCTNYSTVNVSYRTSRMVHEEQLMSNILCSLDNRIERVLSHDQMPFGQEGLNTTIYVYVSDFVTPTVIVVSFAQHASLDLLHFFVVFACCFLSLLVVAAILWKVKQKYDVYRRRQRMIVEMETMARRPFACISLELPKSAEQATGGTRKKVNRSSRMSFVATEPLIDGKHAIMSALIVLPTGDGNYTAPGQAGLAVASTLVSYGSQLRKVSVDQKPDKLKKTTQETET